MSVKPRRPARIAAVLLPLLVAASALGADAISASGVDLLARPGVTTPHGVRIDGDSIAFDALLPADFAVLVRVPLVAPGVLGPGTFCSFIVRATLTHRAPHPTEVNPIEHDPTIALSDGTTAVAVIAADNGGGHAEIHDYDDDGAFLSNFLIRASNAGTGYPPIGDTLTIEAQFHNVGSGFTGASISYRPGTATAGVANAPGLDAGAGLDLLLAANAATEQYQLDALTVRSACLSSTGIEVPPGFNAMVLGSGLDNPADVAVAPPTFGTFGGHVFVSNVGVFNGFDSDTIARIDPAGNTTTFSNVGSIDPGGIAFGIGGFPADLFVAANASSPGVGSGQLWQVDSAGSATPFVFIGNSGSGGLAFDPNGAFGGDAFVGLTGLDGIRRVTSGAGTSLFANIGSLAGGPQGLGFGAGGPFGTDLYMSALSLAGSWPSPLLPGVYRFDPGGTRTVLADSSTSALIGQPGQGLVVGPGGPFGSDLFLPDKTNGTILQIAPDGSVGVFASGLTTPTGLAFDGASTLYVAEADLNRVIKITADILNSPPTADAGADQTVEWAGEGSASVELTAVGTDPDPGDTLSFSWSIDGNEVATGQTVTLDLPLGTTTVVLSVWDGVNGPVTDSVDITVQDTTAPTITAALEPAAGKGDGKSDDDSGKSDGKSGSDDNSGKSDDGSGKSDGKSGKSDDESRGNKDSFTVVATASDACDPDPEVVAEINGHPVENGQQVVIKLKGRRTKFKVKKGVLHVETPMAVLTVTATDSSGNSATEIVKLSKGKGDDGSS